MAEGTFRYPSKPPLGTVLDRDHPYTIGLRGLWIPQDKGGVPNLAAPNIKTTITGAPTFVPSNNAIAGLAIRSLSTNDYLDLGNTGTTNWLKPSLPITLMAIFSTSVSAASRPIIGNDIPAAAYAGVFMHGDATASFIFASYGQNSGTNANQRRSIQSAAAIVANRLYLCIAVIRGQADMDMYVNGVDQGHTYSGTGSAMAYSSSSGRIASGPSSRFLNGNCHYAALWAKNMRPAEAMSLSENPYQFLLPPAALRRSFYIRPVAPTAIAPPLGAQII